MARVGKQTRGFVQFGGKAFLPLSIDSLSSRLHLPHSPLGHLRLVLVFVHGSEWPSLVWFYLPTNRLQ